MSENHGIIEVGTRDLVQKVRLHVTNPSFNANTAYCPKKCKNDPSEVTPEHRKAPSISRLP